MNSHLEWKQLTGMETGRVKITPACLLSAHLSALACLPVELYTDPVQESYDAVCKALALKKAPELVEAKDHNAPTTGITVGPYRNCVHLASGLVSEVYRSGAVALKVITETWGVEPHNADREVKTLRQISHPSIIKLVETIKDDEGRLVLAFPYIPLTLATVLESRSIDEKEVISIFKNLFSALDYLHGQGIIHRDIKPSNLLLQSPTSPAYLADFGTVWHPQLSVSDEPADHKILDVGTSSYRAPEALFGNRSYGTSLDMWAAGAMLAEALRKPPTPLFQSRAASEDGNQLGLILSIFKTLGTPTKETWPEAVHFSTPPFEWYQEFPGKSWEELLPDASSRLRDIVSKLMSYESSKRLTARQADGLLMEDTE
jgi:cyclin-dependent kinase